MLTNEGVKGVNVLTTKGKICFSYDGCGDKTLKKTRTDENGFYSISYRGKGKRLVFYCDDETVGGCDYIGSQGASIELEYEQTHYDLGIAYIGYFQRYIKNVNCFDSTDELHLTHSWNELNTSNYLTDGVYMGCFEKTYSISEVVMGWQYKEGYVVCNGITTPFIDSVYVPANDTVVWNIEH